MLKSEHARHSGHYLRPGIHHRRGRTGSIGDPGAELGLEWADVPTSIAPGRAQAWL